MQGRRDILVLGGGTAGTLMANKLARRLDGRDWNITVVDRDDDHLYQPGLLFLPFGGFRESWMRRSRRRLIDPPARLVLGSIDRIDPDAHEVALADGTRLRWDILIVATGTRVQPELTEGLTGPGWRTHMHDFYTLEGARHLARTFDGHEGGRIVLDVVDMPIKCPVAPLEFLFRLESFLRRRGRRDATEIVYLTPLEGAFTKPRASAVLGNMLVERGIQVEPDFSVERVDDEARGVRSHDGREVPFDLLVTVPLHGGSEAIARSGLGDPMGFFPTDRHTLKARDFDDVFALGDATDLPSSKAGAVAHFQGEVLIENVLRAIEGRSLEPAFDGHANCFIESGDGRALLIDFNYDVEPLPGRFPLPGIGPLTLLGESAINHWGKLAFRTLYWHAVVKGRELPIEPRLSMLGKRP